MAHGFFTLEQWKRPVPRAAPRWVPIRHFNHDITLSGAIQHLENLGRPGFYRVTQTQRMIWAEKTEGRLRLRKWHAGSPEALARSVEAFDRDGGRWPVTKARGKKRSGLRRA
jgi:hypothetical protein